MKFYEANKKKEKLQKTKMKGSSCTILKLIQIVSSTFEKSYFLKNEVSRSNLRGEKSRNFETCSIMSSCYFIFLDLPMRESGDTFWT